MLVPLMLVGTSDELYFAMFHIAGHEQSFFDEVLAWFFFLKTIYVCDIWWAVQELGQHRGNESYAVRKRTYQFLFSIFGMRI